MLFIGHSLSTLTQFVRYHSVVVRAVAGAISYALPNLEKFNIRNLAVHHIPIGIGALALAGLYALLYSSALLYLTKVLLAKKEL